MDVGLLVPQGFNGEFKGWSASRAWDRILEVVRLAESLGFSSLWTGEHLLAADSGTDPIFECFTLTAAISQHTSAAEVGFAVLCAPFRTAGVTAKMATTLDVISRGRLVLGLGAGWKEDEFRAFGYEFDSPGARLRVLRDHLEVIRVLWNGGGTYDGEHATINSLRMRPIDAGVRRIPIMVGGKGESVTFRLAARYADELNLNLRPDAMERALPVLAARCEELGRDPKSLRVSAIMPETWVWRDSDRFTFATGKPVLPPSTLSRIEALARWRELGVTRVIAHAPGVAANDEPLLELREDCLAAGATFTGRN